MANRRGILWLAVAISITLFPLWQGAFYAAGDVRDIIIPLEDFFQQEQRSGQIPAWHPDIAWGYPVIAAAQIGFFYPPLLLLRWFLPLEIYLPAVVLGHFFALAFGTYTLLRKLNITAVGSYVGSLSFTLSGFVLQHITHLNILFAFAWLPWQLATTVRIASQKHVSLRDAALLTLLLGTPYLAGQLQVPLLMSVVTSALFLYIRYKKTRTFARPLATIALLALGVLTLVAVQLLPTLELVGYSSRSAAGDFSIERANQHSFPLYHLPTILFPHFFGHDHTYWGKRLEIEYGFFIGTIPILLAWSVFWRKNPAQNDRVRFFKWLLIISFLLALGGSSPFRLIGIEPSLWYFSGPARWLLFTTLSFSIFAAVGFDQLQQTDYRFKKLAARAAIVVIAGVILTNVILFTQGNRLSHLPLIPDHQRDKITQLITSAQQASVSLLSPYTALPLIMLAATALITTRRYTVRLFVLLATAELVIIGMATTQPAMSWKKILERPEITHYLPTSVQEKEARIYSIRPPGDTGAYFTNPESRAGARIREQQRQLLIPLLHAQFGIAGIEWPASLDLEEHHRKLEELRGNDGYYIQDKKLAHELTIGALLVPENLPQPQDLSKHTNVSGINIYAINAAPRASLEDAAGRQLPHHVEYKTVSPTETRIVVNTHENATLIVRDTWYPGWKAYSDGIPVKISKAYSIFRAIDVPSGQHTITMAYTPYLLYAGMAISSISFVFCCMQFLTRPTGSRSKLFSNTTHAIVKRNDKNT